MATQLWAIGLVLLGDVISAFAPVLLKKGSAQFNLNPIKQLKNYPLIGGVILYGISTVTFIIALRGGELSVLYPLVSINYILVSILGILLFKEHMNTLKWTGILLIIVGTSLIGLGS